jgi:hypothetical protein
MRRLYLLGAWLGLLAGCRPSDPQPVRIEASPLGRDTRLVLQVTSGLRVNAKLDPALELPDGSVLRFHSDSVSPDSAYFAAPPVAVLVGHHPGIHGTLRASVCDSAATVCRILEVEL